VGLRLCHWSQEHKAVCASTSAYIAAIITWLMQEEHYIKLLCRRSIIPNYTAMNLKSCCRLHCHCNDNYCCSLSVLVWADGETCDESHETKWQGLYGSNPSVHTCLYYTNYDNASLPISCQFKGFNISMPDKGSIWASNFRSFFCIHMRMTYKCTVVL